MTSWYRTSRRSRRPGGLTLIEMILVLAVLVMIGALALPALRGPLEDQRLRKAGDLVRAQWTHARVAAMRTGQIHVFRYELGGPRYSVEPWEQASDQLEASTDGAAPTGAGPIGAPAIDPRNARSPFGVAGSLLPPGIAFHAAEVGADSRSSEIQDQATGAGAAAASARPIVFYPDGTATDARLVLTNQRCFVELSLRGLTGLSRGSDLMAAEELTR